MLCILLKKLNPVEGGAWVFLQNQPGLLGNVSLMRTLQARGARGPSFTAAQLCTEPTASQVIFITTVSMRERLCKMLQQIGIKALDILSFILSGGPGQQLLV